MKDYQGSLLILVQYNDRWGETFEKKATQIKNYMYGYRDYTRDHCMSYSLYFIYSTPHTYSSCYTVDKCIAELLCNDMPQALPHDVASICLVQYTVYDGV